MALKPFWILVTAVLLAAALRLRSIGRLTRGFLLVLVVIAALFAVNVIHPPSIEELVQQIGSRLGNWTYLLVGVNAFLETGAFLGFIAPGETMVLFGGVLAGEGTIDLATLIAVVWFSAMAGDVSAYVIGRRAGRGFLIRHGQRIKVGEAQIQFVEGFFTRHGRATVLLGRWVGVVRPLVPFLAGSSRMRFAEFIVIDIVATAAWAAGLCIVGSIFWHNFNELVSLVGRALFILGVLIVVIVALVVGTNARRDPERRRKVNAWIAEQQEEHPLVAKPALALWVLMARIEPHLPGAGKARATEETDTVGPR
ncbi:MAG: DedA family protein [Solirubrobacteraceae bacterium]|nr:DedA family protein [Solirubrobacteraceae bacterium]